MNWQFLITRQLICIEEILGSVPLTAMFKVQYEIDRLRNAFFMCHKPATNHINTIDEVERLVLAIAM